MMHERMCDSVYHTTYLRCTCGGLLEVVDNPGMTDEVFQRHVGDCLRAEAEPPPARWSLSRLVDRWVAWVHPRSLLVDDVMAMRDERDQARAQLRVMSRRATEAERNLDTLRVLFETLAKEGSA